MCSNCAEPTKEALSDWQPAIIAPHAHVAKLHRVEPGAVSRYAGECVRVRENEECSRQMHSQQKMFLGCTGRTIELHPDDAARLFPEDFERIGGIALCTCAVLMD